MDLGPHIKRDSMDVFKLWVQSGRPVCALGAASCNAHVRREGFSAARDGAVQPIAADLAASAVHVGKVCVCVRQ